jgi:hypothetical protein
MCYGMGIFGYVLMLMELTGLTSPAAATSVDPNAPPPPSVFFEYGFFMLLYGVYFGILGRDIVQLLADHMAHSIGVCFNIDAALYSQRAVLQQEWISAKTFTIKHLCDLWECCKDNHQRRIIFRRDAAIGRRTTDGRVASQ